MPKVLKLVLIAIGTMLLLFIVGVKVVLEPFLEQSAREYLAKTKSEFYTFNFEKLNLRLLNGSIRLRNVESTPGPWAFDSLQAGVYNDIDQITASDVFVSINYFAYLSNKELKIKKILISNPEVTIFYTSDTVQNRKDPMAVEHLLSDSFTGFSLEQLQLENARLSVKSIYKDSIDLSLDSLLVDIKNLQLNNQTLDTAKVGFVFDHIKMSASNLRYAIDDYYWLQVNDLTIDIEKDTTQIAKETDVRIQGIQYKPSALAFDEITNNQRRHVMEISSQKVHIRQLKVSDWLLHHKITLQKLEIEEPSIKYLINSKMQPNKKVSSPSLQKQVQMAIGQFAMTNGRMTISDIHKSASDLNLQEVDINFEDIVLTDSTKTTPFGFSFSKGTFTSSQSTSDLGTYYRMGTGKIALNFVTENASVSNLSLTPKQSRKAFTTSIPYEMDQYTLQVNNMSFNRIDLSKLRASTALEIRSIMVDGVKFNVYRDKWVKDQEFVYKPLPSRVIRNIPFPFYVDTLSIVDAHVVYEQLGDVVAYDGEEPGKVTFSNLSASALHITNKTEELRKNPILQLTASATFMGESRLDARYRFVIPDTMDTHYVNASMKNFHTVSLDPMVKNLLLVEIPDGIIHSIDLDLVGNDTLMTGKLEMEYENFNVNVLKSKNPQKSNGFLNMVANGVLRRNNMRNGKFIIGLVEFSRYRNKSVFNYSWNGVKSGLISTAVPFTKSEKVKSKPSK